MTKKAHVAEHPVPEAVIEDLSCALHNAAGLNMTILGLYNYFMRPIREWWRDGTKICVLVLDKGVPAIKIQTSTERDEVRKKWEPPYDEKRHSISDETGNLLCDGEDMGNVFVVSRLINNRAMRKILFHYLFTRILPSEPIPKGCQLWIDYSLDSKESPIGMGDGTSEKRRFYHNEWLEGDWAISYWIAKLATTGVKSALAVSIDGDMIPILCWNLHLRKNRDDCQVYLYNNVRSKNERTLSINSLVKFIYQIDSGWSMEYFMLLFPLCGNDYVEKPQLINGVGAANLMDRIKRYRSATPTTRDVTWVSKMLRDPKLFMDFIRRMHTANKPPPTADIEFGRRRINDGLTIYTECVTEPAPSLAIAKEPPPPVPAPASNSSSSSSGSNSAAPMLLDLL